MENTKELKIPIDLALHREISFAEISQGYSNVFKNRGKKTRDILKSKLKYIKKGLELEEKLDELKEMWNRGKKKQILFLDTWPMNKRHSDSYEWKNISIMSSLNEEDASELGANILVMICSGSMTGGQMNLTLSRIELLSSSDATFEVDEEARESIVQDSWTNWRIEWTNEPILIKKNPRNLSVFNFLDLKDKIEDRVRLRDWFSFLKPFTSFLNTKMKEKESGFFYDINSTNISQPIIYDKKAKSIKFHIGIRRENNLKFVELGQRINLSNSQDSDISFVGFVEKSREIDYNEDIDNEIIALEEQSEILREDLANKKKIVEETLKQQKIIRDKVDSLESSQMELFLDKERIEAEIKEINSEIKANTNSVKEKQKNFKENNYLKSQLDQKNQKLIKINTKNEEAIESIAGMPKETLTKKEEKKRETLKNEIISNFSEMDAIKKELDQISLKNQLISKETERLEIKLIELNEVLKNKNNILKACESDLTNLNTSLKTWKKDGEKVFITLKRERKNIDELSNKADLVKRKNSKLIKFQKNIDSSEFKIFEISLKLIRRDDKKNVDIIFQPINLYDQGREVFFTPQWEISMFNFGTLTKIKRYYNAIDNFKSGFYKNPYQLTALMRPSLISEKKYNEAKRELEITNKHKLNENQIKATAKAIATRDISYIQGPPGTGKTQTIAALAEYGVTKGETILVSSSTHAAIDNFFERIDGSYDDNPNIFLLRYIYRVKDNYKNNFSEEDLFKRYLSSIDKSLNNNLNKLKQVNKIDFNKFKEVINKINEIDPDGKFAFHESKLSKFTLDEASIEMGKEPLNALYNLISSREETYIKLFDDEDLTNILQKLKGIIKNSVDFFDIEAIRNASIAEVNVRVIKLNNLILEIREQESFKLFNELLNDMLDNDLVSDEDATIETLETIVNTHLNKEDTQETPFQKLYKKISIETQEYLEAETILIREKAKENKLDSRSTKKSLLNSKYTEHEAEFLETLFKHQLLNVIGITTSSRKNIDFIGKNVDLFIDYSIDRVIIDEVSKSNTPEILSNINLASRVNLAGDYRQLNPIFDIEEDLISEFVNSDYYQDLRKYSNFLETNDQGEYDRAAGLTKYLQTLYEESLFANQIGEINKKQKNEWLNSYQYLTKQYRFTNEIMKVVNEISYKGVEELTLGRSLADFKTYSFEIDGKTSSGAISLIDTSYLSKNYLDKLMSEKKSDKETLITINPGDRAFDQDASIRWYTGRKEKSKINDFNAFVIVEAIENMVINQGIESEKIGVIAMTNSQSKLIYKYINNHKFKDQLNGIRVDTVDNFQGSESEIIFVDLVRAAGQYKIKDDKRGFLMYPTKRNLEFYKKPQRLNVALSRAKAKLIIVGAVEGHLLNLESKISIDGIEKDILMFDTINNNVKGEDKISWNKYSTSNETFSI